ncbi:methyl-accepting chemotaxis protein, partial [Streptomyces sp900116325]
MKMNVRKKLFAGFFSVLILLVIVTAITNYQFRTVDESYTEAIEDRFGNLNLISKMERAILEEQIALRGYLINGNEESLNQFGNSAEDFKSSSGEFLNLKISSEARKLIEDLVEVEKQYQQVGKEAIEFKKQNRLDGITRLMQEKGNAITQKINEVGEKARIYQEKNLIETSDNLSHQVSVIRNLILFISVAAFILGVAIAIYIGKIISKPVQLISKSAEQIADGNLLIDEINIKNKDEIGHLAVSFNRMTRNLRDLIHQVSSTSEHVASSAEELLASTEQTNSATNQVVTSIQEIAGGAEIQGKNTEES